MSEDRARFGEWTRREWLAAAAGVGSLGALARAACREKPATILLCSGWQTVNIGDIAHTPGLLRLLEAHLPDIRVILWPSSDDRGVREMLTAAFPRVRIVHGQADAEGKPDTPELRDAFEEADFFLHGSGPSLVKRDRMERWNAGTGKPYGAYGVTIQDVTPEVAALVRGAAFVFGRETHTVANLKKAGITEPAIDFAPDATFACDLRDDAAGDRFRHENGLDEDGFLCVVPRLRYTPYHQIHPERKHDPVDVEMRDTVNAQTQEADHAKLREAIIAWVRQTGRKVLVCPEMTYQTQIIDPLVHDPLPEDVKPKVVRRLTYWITDEATSVYAHAAAVLSAECHSPILSSVQGVPGLYVRQPTDTIKGQMWYDIGLDDWVFEIERTTGADLAAAVLAIAADPERAAGRLERAMGRVRAQHDKTMGIVGATLQEST